MEDSNRKGLRWETEVLGPSEPAWIYEPCPEAIEKVCRKKLGIAEESTCAVIFHAEGCFNKLYIEVPDHTTHPKALMRVSLPVDPHHKALGEVATMRWVKQKTNIPVPAVICWNESNNDDIGFPWILMEFMPGTTLYQRWRKMAMTQKTALVERVADFEAQLLQASATEHCRGIGTLFIETENEDNFEATAQVMKPGRIVEQHFFTDDHIDYDIPRGPFKSSHDWLATYSDITIRHHTAALDNPENEEADIDWIKAFVRVSNKLVDLLPKVFPSIQHPAERTYLWHDDLNSNNILVNDQGEITAILDWESLSCLPLWASTQTPDFLKEAPREKKPLRHQYADDNGKIQNDSGLDNDGKNELFWEHLLEWEATQLRNVYNARMEQLRPGWEQECLDGALKKDILLAARLLTMFCFNIEYIEWWVDMVGKGDVRDLREVLRSRFAVPMARDQDSNDLDDSDSDESNDSRNEDHGDDRSEAGKVKARDAATGKIDTGGDGGGGRGIC